MGRVTSIGAYVRFRTDFETTQEIASCSHVVPGVENEPLGLKCLPLEACEHSVRIVQWLQTCYERYVR